MRRVRRLLLPVLAVLLSAGCADQLTPAAAMVDGHRISEATVERELDFLRDDAGYQSLLDQVGEEYRGEERRRLLTQLIHIALVDRELERRRAPVTRADVDATMQRIAVQQGGEDNLRRILSQEGLDEERFRELVRRQASVEKLQRLLTEGQEPDPAEVEAAYTANLAMFQQARLSRITVADAEEAEEVVSRLGEGAQVARLARERSTDDAADGGGDLGWVDLRTVGEARQEIEAVADGQVVGPVEVMDGFRVYVVHERRQAPLADVEQEIADALMRQEREQAIERFLRGGLAEARVVVNPKYGRFDADQLAVVPNDVRVPR